LANRLTVGVPLALTMFAGLDPVLEAKLQIPMVIYQGLQIVGGSIMIRPLRNWIDKEKDQATPSDKAATTIDRSV
jgi:solute carrier family 10 (sodium/bile acid cotransporter), member 7